MSVKESESPRRSPYLDDLLTTHESAEYISVSPASIARYQRDGLIEPTRIGGRVFFATAELDCFILSGGRP